jgi:DNA-binding NtrC family response regulator
MLTRILILSGSQEHQNELGGVITKLGCVPVRSDTLSDAKDLVRQLEIEGIVCDEVLPDGSFRALIRELRKSACQTPVVVVSESDDWGSYLEAMVAGAFDVVVYPPYPRDLERVVSAALAESRSNREAMARTAA